MLGRQVDSLSVVVHPRGRTGHWGDASHAGIIVDFMRQIGQSRGVKAQGTTKVSHKVYCLVAATHLLGATNI